MSLSDPEEEEEFLDLIFKFWIFILINYNRAPFRLPLMPLPAPFHLMQQHLISFTFLFFAKNENIFLISVGIFGRDLLII